MRKPIITYIPYKSIKLKETTPILEEKEELTIILLYKQVKFYKIEIIAPKVSVLVKSANRKDPIPPKEWSDELQNLINSLIKLYPNPHVQTKEEVLKLNNKTKKWLLAGLVFLLILFILYKKMYLS